MLRDFIMDMLRDVFRGWIHLVERRKIIQIAMVHRANYRLDYLFQMDKIVEQARGVEFLPFHRYAHTIIVTVLVFALAVISTQVVPC